MGGIRRDRLVEVLHYDPSTGEFRWKSKTNKRIKKGAVAGCNCPNGGLTYRTIRIDGRLYRAHRLAWLYMTGSFPDGMIDHADGNGLNNRWCNLRVATRTENQRNQKRRTDNTSGTRGVSRCRRSGKWKAYINVHGRQYSLGLHQSQSSAINARHAAEIKHFGEFARVK